MCGIKDRTFHDEDPEVQMTWVNVLLDYCDRRKAVEWDGEPDVLDEMHLAFAAGLKAGRAE